MRIPGNKLKHLRDFFHSELKEIYPQGEINAMFATAAFSVLGFTQKDLLLKAESNLNQSDLLKLYDCAKDLKQQIPLQYILKEAWFYGFKFFVSNSVLIPRPETEELVDLIVKENPSLVSLLDLGTGSGCIPVSVKKMRPATRVHGCDISPEALAVARKNAVINDVAVNFFEADILATGKTDEKINGSFEVLVSNPPYIKATEKKSMSPNVLEHEPHLALFVEDADVIIFYRKIIDLCTERLLSEGKLYFELNPLTAQEVKDYADSKGIFQHVALIKDMSGAVRFLKAVRK